MRKTVRVPEDLTTAPADINATARPMRDLLRQLPRLRSDRQGNVDYANSHRVIVAETGQNAECIARALHMGMGAIGHLGAELAVTAIRCRRAGHAPRT